MCGIFGVAGLNHIDKNKFTSATNLIRHRGPDAQSISILEKEGVGLGFNRLSILDLSSAADQPMWDEKKTVGLIFNGEIYNFLDLKRELEAEGVHFKTRSDSEVILRGYRAWGWDKLLSRLEGMFAIGLYDVNRKILHLARDRFGMKPLYFSEIQGGICFSSEIKSILEYTGHRKINYHGALNPIFTTGLSPKGETMFDGVKELDSGDELVFDLSKKQIKVSSFFHLSDWVDESTYRQMSRVSDHELTNLFSEAMKDSVKKHLQSDAPLGILFSAGLDSSLVAAIAGGLSEEKLNLYKFTSRDFDDRGLAQSFSDQFNGKLHDVKDPESNYILQQPKMLYHYEVVNKPEGAVLGNLCRGAKEDGMKVLLTGDSSDEVFGGYPQHKEFYIRSLFSHKTALNKFVHYGKRLIPGLDQLGNKFGDYLMAPKGFDLLEIPMSVLFHRGTRMADWKKCLEAYRFEKNRAVAETNAYLLDEVAYRLKRFMIRADRFGMMESVELRLPFLHPALVKLAINTPCYRRIKFGVYPKARALVSEKHIVKQMARKAGVPSGIINRKKMGTPFDNRLSEKRLIEKWNLDNVSHLLNINSKALKETLLDSHSEVGKARMQWCVIATEILIRLFIQSSSPEKIEEEFKNILNVKSEDKVLS